MGDARSATTDLILIACLPCSVPTVRLAPLRLSFPSAEIASDGESYWIRLLEGAGDNTELHMLPLTALYHLHSDLERLIPFGDRYTLPVARLPKNLAWRPLIQTILPRLPIAALGGTPPVDRLLLKLVPSPFSMVEPNLLLSTFERLSRYAETSSLLRLAPLRFAVSEDQRVIVIGTPLPGMAGEHYLVKDRIALPFGYHFEPIIGAGELHQLLELAPTEIAFFAHDTSFERLHQDDFLRLNRSAIHLTQQRLDRGSTARVGS